MVPGGGHRKNNPRIGIKSPARGDRKREEKAGRKRISREYREKGPSVVSLTESQINHEFSIEERKILYALDKGSNYGKERSRDLEQLFKNRNLNPKTIPELISIFKDKIHRREWGSIYIGEDSKTYIYLNVHKINIIKNYINMNEPFLSARFY